MKEKIKADVWLLVDANGNSACGSTMDEAVAAYQENVQGFPPEEAFRFVRLAVTVPLPEQGVIAVEVPDADNEPAVV